MSIELDLVQQYLNDGASVTADDLPNARGILDALISEASQASEAEVSKATRRGRRRTWRRVGLSVGVAALVLAITVLVVRPNPVTKPRRAVTASMQIDRLADAVKSAPPLQPGQWSTVEMTGQLSAQVGTVGSTPTPDAKASIPLTFDVWSSGAGTTCTSQQFGTASFATPANAQAWHAIGLIDTPTNQPVTGCVAGVEAQNGSGLMMTPIDVASLTQDPKTLATELQDGDTGIPQIDQSTRGVTSQQNGFERLAILLVGPTSGAWPGYGQELLQSMALFPGVTSLGRMTTQSRQVGLAFTSATAVEMSPKTGAIVGEHPSPMVIVDPTTGALLEARNFSIPVLQGAAQDFVGSTDAPVYTEGGGYGISTTWIDPVGQPNVVQQSSLPSWISSFHLVEAVTNANSYGEAISNALDPFLGNGNSSFSDSNVPAQGETTFDITITDPSTSVAAIVAALNSTGLFQSVTVKA